MKVIVIGLGSMGRRRIRLIKQFSEAYQVIGVDGQEERRTQAEEELGIVTFPTIDAACRNGNPDAAFVSTPPLSHASIIKECLKRGMHVFTELNLSPLGYEDILQLSQRMNKVVFLSSTFLYRKEIQRIREAVASQSHPLSYSYHSGQYLPDWHPWESYKAFFAGHKETNGCREIMAIEFPWITDVFGEIQSVRVLKGRKTSLDIDFDDNYHLLIGHRNGNTGMVAVNVISRKAVRNLEVYGEGLYLSWNGKPDGLSILDLETKEEHTVKLYEFIDKRKEYCSSIIENAYYSEITNFFETIRGEALPEYSFEKDKTILSIIDTIEKGQDYDE